MNGNDRSIVGLASLAHALVHTYELSVPVLVTVWLDAFGASTATMGAAVTAGYALFGLGALPGGMIADTFGSRRTIAACLAGMAGSFLLLSLAQGLVMVTLALLVWGAAASVYHPSGLSLISRGVTDRPSGFAYHGMAGNFGIAFGPLATTVLLIELDWRPVVTLLAVPAAVGAMFAFRAEFDEEAAVPSTDGGQPSDSPDPGSGVPEGDAAGPGDGPGGSGTSEDRGEAPAGSDDRGDPDGADDREDPAGTDDRDALDGADDREDPGGAVSSLPELVEGTRLLFGSAFVLVFAVMISSGLFYRGVLTFLPEVLAGFEGFDPVQVGGRTLEPSRFAYVGLLTVGMAGQFAGGRLTGIVDPARGIVGSFSGLAVLALVFVPASEVGLAVLVVVGIALGVNLFLVQPMYQELVARLTPSGTRGLSYGYAYLGVFGVGALGGVIAGTLLEVASVSVLFSGLALVALAAAGFGVVLTRRT